MSISEIVASGRESADGLSFTIPEIWMQGRTTYGGLSSALALEAARRIVPDLPALRTTQISFVGPLAGEVTASARLLRRGRTAAFVEVALKSQGNIGLTGTFVFMDALPSHIDHSDLPAPAVLHEGDGDPHHPDVPAFVHNFDMKRVPVEGASAITRWVRFRDRGVLDPMTELLAIADALPPAALKLATRQGPISSMTWLVNMLDPRPETRDGWWLLRSTNDYARGGCASQTMTVWNTDGVPVASGMQSVALFI